MKFISILIVCFLILSACTKNKSEKVSTPIESTTAVTERQQSYAFPAIKWEGRVYKVTTEEVSDVEKEIGEVKEFSGIELKNEPDNFSNHFPVGTKLYSIKNIDTKTAIAIKLNENKYIKAKLFNS